jgi:hypothetical protein
LNQPLKGSGFRPADWWLKPPPGEGSWLAGAATATDNAPMQAVRVSFAGVTAEFRLARRRVYR